MQYIIEEEGYDSHQMVNCKRESKKFDKKLPCAEDVDKNREFTVRNGHLNSNKKLFYPRI
jgi:hypothetical protein